ncbi:MAG: hypothetical protein R2862_11510 [Thermoanaerobaculia bacterium]
MKRFPILIALAALPCIPSPAPAQASSPVGAPVALAEPASGAPRLAAAKAAGRIELPAGGDSAQVENRVEPGVPTSYLFRVPAGSMVSIGISSPRGDVRMALYFAGDDRPVPGAGWEDGAIRWISSVERATELRLVAFAAGEASPFRFAVTAKPVSN